MAQTIIKQWRVKFVEGPDLILYADEGEELSALDHLILSAVSIEPTGKGGVGTDGKNTYDGKDSL